MYTRKNWLKLGKNNFIQFLWGEGVDYNNFVFIHKVHIKSIHRQNKKKRQFIWVYLEKSAVSFYEETVFLNLK